MKILLFSDGIWTFVLMSALFSKHKHWVSGGTYELFESVWVVFAYMLLCYYVYNFVNEEKHVEFILKISGIGMAIVTVIGVFQYFGLDFFQSNFGKHLITNPGWWKNLKELTFNFVPKTSYTTLYNPNFYRLFWLCSLCWRYACLLRQKEYGIG